MNENKKMTSIARRINISFWLRQFLNYLGLDVLLITLLLGSYLMHCHNQVTNEYHISNIGKLTVSPDNVIIYTIETSDGKVHIFSLREFETYVFPIIVILAAFEILGLITSLFKTGAIRRKLKPLNDLAIKAEEISSMPFDERHLEHLKTAITNVSPDEPEAKIQTGDKDLMSIEVALNNLLARMKESQRQQARFVSDASHELRTPISVIQGYVNMLDRWGKEDPQVLEESIEALKNESDHMKELIEQLLFLARGDSGRNTLRKTEFDMVEMVQEVCDESAMIDAAHVYDFKEPNKSPILYVGDQAMLKQSIRVFVQNAAKYSNDGDTITLAVRQEDNRILYSVQDEGIGMVESDVAHIFERFYRSDEARNSETGGSGLGLSIAKWIVDAHGGTIEVLSRPEFGTRFTVILNI